MAIVWPQCTNEEETTRHCGVTGNAAVTELSDNIIPNMPDYSRLKFTCYLTPKEGTGGGLSDEIVEGYSRMLDSLYLHQLWVGGLETSR